jgi:hypothetical protein
MTWFPAPSAAEERAEAVRRVAPGVKVEAPWRHYGLLLRMVFFVFGLIAVLALFGFLSLLSLPKGFLTAALAIAAAEWLIRQHRFFGTGVEAALWLGGTFSFIFGLPSSGKVEAILVFAAATALCGWRLRSAIFGVLATVLVLAYVAAKWDHQWLLAMSLASLIAIASAFALRRLWKRPSTERLFLGLALVMPVAGYLATIAQRLFKTYSASVPVAVVLGITALVLFAAGIAWRARVLLVSGTISVALVAVELRDFFDYTIESKLIAAGILIIAIAATIGRALRGSTRGFVVTPVRVNAYDEAMQIGGIISIAPHAAPAAHSGPDLADSASPTDKSFGGAGAGAEF